MKNIHHSNNILIGLAIYCKLGGIKAMLEHRGYLLSVRYLLFASSFYYHYE